MPRYEVTLKVGMKKYIIADNEQDAMNEASDIMIEWYET